MSKNNNKQVVTEEIEVTEALAVAPATTSALANAGEFDNEFEGDQDKLTKDDILLDRYRLVQGMTKGRRELGLEEGALYATASKRSFETAVVVPIMESRVIVERQVDKTSGGQSGPNDGKFVAELSIDNPRVVAALKANNQSYIHLHSAEGTEFKETRNVYVAFLSPDDGVTCTGFGILQAESTNLRPVLDWKTQRVGWKRVGGKSANTLPMYAFRTVVDGKGVHQKNQTALYRFNPYKNNSWKDSAIDPDNRIPEELELLRKLKAHKELITSGAVKVAEYSDADDSEAAQEAAAF